MSCFRLSPALPVALLALVFSVGGFAVAASSTTPKIVACAAKRTGILRLASPTGRCARNENAVSWNQRGQVGPAGHSGSPDTPSQVLAKVEQVDGSGSGLDADTIRGLAPTAFLPATGTAADTSKVAGTPGTDVVVGRRIPDSVPPAVPGRTTTSADRAVIAPSQNASLANYSDGRGFQVTCAPDAASASVFFFPIPGTEAVVSQSDVTATSPPFTATQTIQDVSSVASLTAHRSSLFVIQSGSGSSPNAGGSNTVQTLVATVVDNGMNCTAMTQEINAVR